MGLKLDYLPRDPRSYSASIGLIGCGRISARHLAAYRRAGYRVVALCDIVPERAITRRDEYFPEATVVPEAGELLARDDIDVIDIATHVDVRPGLVEQALRARKHVLSQKPFVLDLADGARLCELADQMGRLLAVNQNGRWAPHFAALLAAHQQGLLGSISSADFAVYWAHDEAAAGSPEFANMSDLILYDFGIHWFDLVATLVRDRLPASRVFAQTGRLREQAIPVDTQAQVVIELQEAQVSLLFRGAYRSEELGSYRVVGSSGVAWHWGKSLGGDSMILRTAAGEDSIVLVGDWWTNGMHGAMGELLCAIESGRQPSNAARSSLPGLALCFAAIRSAKTGVSVDPSTITTP